MTQSSLKGPKCVVVSVSAEPHTLPVFWCFGLVGTFLGREWKCFPQQMTRWNWKWIKTKCLRSHMYIATQTGAYRRCGRSGWEIKINPYEAKWQADEACSRKIVNLGLALTSFRVPKERLGMKSKVELPALRQTGNVRCQTPAAGLCYLAKLWTSPLNKYNIPT